MSQTILLPNKKTQVSLLKLLFQSPWTSTLKYINIQSYKWKLYLLEMKNIDEKTLTFNNVR